MMVPSNPIVRLFYVRAAAAAAHVVGDRIKCRYIFTCER